MNFTIFKNKTENWIYISAVLVRVIFLFIVVYLFGDRGLVMMGDSPDYLILAEKFTTTHSMTSGIFADMLETTRLPGYPFFLSIFVFFKIPFFIASLIQIFIVSFVPIIIMRLGGYGGLNSKITLFAGLFAVFEPASIVYGVMLLPDAFNAALFMVAFLFMILFTKHNKIKYLYISAVLFALMNYIRPAGLFLGVMFPLCLILYGFITERTRTKIYFKYAFIFAVTFFMVLTPWIARNYIHYGVFSFSSGIERQIYEITGVAVRASGEGVSQQEMLLTMRKEILPILVEPRDLANFKNNGLLLAPALNIIFSYPAQYLKLYSMSLITFFASGNYHYIGSVFHLLEPSPRTISYTMIYATKGAGAMIKELTLNSMQPYGMVTIIGRLVWIILALLTLFGMYIERKNREMLPITLFFLCISVYMAIVILHLTVGIEARHRLFIDPFYYLFVGVSLHAILSVIKKRKNVSTHTG